MAYYQYEMHFEVEIRANKNVVWRTLWDDKTLRVHFDVPSELEEVFANVYPKALARVKQLAERAA